MSVPASAAAAAPSQVPFTMSNSTVSGPGPSSIHGGKLIAIVVGPIASVIVVIVGVLLARFFILRRHLKQRQTQEQAEEGQQQLPVPMLCLSPNCAHPEHGWKGVVPIEEMGMPLRHQQSQKSLKVQEMGFRVESPQSSPARSTRGLYGPRPLPPTPSPSRRYMPRSTNARQMLERTLSQYRVPPPAVDDQQPVQSSQPHIE